MVLPFKRMQFRVLSFLALLAVLVAASHADPPSSGSIADDDLEVLNTSAHGPSAPPHGAGAAPADADPSDRMDEDDRKTLDESVGPVEAANGVPKAVGSVVDNVGHSLEKVGKAFAGLAH